jgi:hypothetical protein
MTIDWRERITIIGQITVSVIIAAGFITIRALMIFVEILPANQRSADTFDGALIGAFSAMVGFWIGSSSSGQKKDATIAAQAAASSAAVVDTAKAAAAKVP